mgnify:CR=1 FL=1
MPDSPICSIRIQTEDFSLDECYQHLRTVSPNKTGAIATFTGLVREYGDKQGVDGLFLEHYPGMTESSLQKIVVQAAEKWRFDGVTIVHRVGMLKLNEQIVFVGVCSSHRSDAFSACEFIMDFLKTEAPFWKKEINHEGNVWVEAKQSDRERSHKWTSNAP